MNPILDALGHVGYALDTPGAYFRGALSGRLGERRSGQELLTDYGLSSADDPWGGAKGFAAEAVLDPLALAAPIAGAWKGTRALTGGARALAGLGDANPLTRRLGELAAGVETPLDAVRHAYRAGETANPLLHGAAELAAGEEGWLKFPLPLSRADDSLDEIGGSLYGGDIHRYADALGPRYPGGVDKVREILGAADPGIDKTGALEDFLAQFHSPSPALDLGRIAGEIPEGSSYLGHGMESVVFRTPHGSAIRVGPHSSPHAPSGVSSARPRIPEVLQPFRVAPLGNDYVAEHLPLVTPTTAGRGISLEDRVRAAVRAGDETRTAGERVEKAGNILGRQLEAPADVLGGQIRGRYPGANPWDLSPDNVGFTPEGRALVLDAGAVAHDPFRGKPPFRTHAYDQAGDVLYDEQINDLVRRGTPEMVRESLARGIEAGTKGQGIEMSPMWQQKLNLAMQRYGIAAEPYLGQWPESEVLKLLQQLRGG